MRRLLPFREALVLKPRLPRLVSSLRSYPINFSRFSRGGLPNRRRAKIRGEIRGQTGRSPKFAAEKLGPVPSVPRFLPKTAPAVGARLRLFPQGLKPDQDGALTAALKRCATQRQKRDRVFPHVEPRPFSTTSKFQAVGGRGIPPLRLRSGQALTSHITRR